jgi:ubiquinone/menaquinone biosynthesis C-methylase UbiE
MDISKLSHRYTGNSARDYDKERVGEKKWLAEEKIVKRFLAQLPEGSSVLDIPVGTGRFISLYKQFNFRATGIDVSRNMLDESKEKLIAHSFKMDLNQGSIFKIGFPEGYFDIVLCVRFLNWIDYSNLNFAIKEISRVSHRNLIVGVRHFTPFNEIAINTPSGILRFIRQCIMRLCMCFKKQKLIFHKKREVSGLFEKYSLVISEAAQVDKRADGTDYFIYLLRKNEKKNE